MIKIAIPQMGTDLFRRYMKSKYQKSLENAGATVVWIELGDTGKAISEALACDGLLLPGGADVNPELYGEKPTPECGKPNTLRDTAEPSILDAFLKTGKPVFCICRGIQLLNVHLGGTLYQDIKPMQKVKHSDFFKRASFTHEVTLSKGSLIKNIIGKDKIKVNSIHHQTVKVLGKGLTATATSEDGFIEAAELENYGFCLAVQWHPEHMAKNSREQIKLFEAFVSACEF